VNVKRKTMLWTGAASLTLLALLAWAFAPRPVAVELASVSAGAFENTIDEDGRTRVRDRYVVSAPLAGRLQRSTLHEGDGVAAGDVVATLMPVLSPMLDERTLREQRARLGSAQDAAARAGTRIDAAKVALERVRLELRRTEQLAQQGFVAPTKVEADRLSLQAAQTELATAVDSERMARHDLELARAALGAVRSGTAAGFALRAPVAGRVLKLHQSSEATVALGSPLVDIGDTSKLEVVAELLTSDALAVSPGSAVRIERWGGPTVLLGRVARVEPAAFTKISALGVEEQRVKVLIDLTSPQAEWAALGDGYRVVVRIVTRSESQVLRVPVSAVFPRAQAQGSAVFVVDGGRAQLRPVTLGARNGVDAWVQQGLAAGETVIVYPPATVADGVRVKARKN
jgi:HlyD family secretion protein